MFAMEVDEILGYARYYRDQRFASKVPDYTKAKFICKCGDNIYKPLPNGGFHQLRSMHSNEEQENPESKAHDLKGKRVLIGKTFYYFGSAGPHLPTSLYDLKVGRGHKNRFSGETISAFLTFISSFPQGINAPPTNWPTEDTSWHQEDE